LVEGGGGGAADAGGTDGAESTGTGAVGFDPEPPDGSSAKEVGAARMKDARMNDARINDAMKDNAGKREMTESNIPLEVRPEFPRLLFIKTRGYWPSPLRL
jgi:hypothetical protein